MTTTSKTLTLLALTTTTAALAAAPASATITPRPHIARYAVTASGTQVTTWHWRKDSVQGACKLFTQGDGDQTIRTKPLTKDETVGVSDGGIGSPEFLGNVSLSSAVNRNAEQRGNRPVGFSRSGCTGTTPLPVYRFPLCGDISGKMKLALELGGGHVSLRGIHGTYGAGSLMDEYQGCPLMMDAPGRAEAWGETILAKTGLRDSVLIGMHARRKITLHASATRRFKIPGGYGKTIATYNVTLKRLAGS